MTDMFDKIKSCAPGDVFNAPNDLPGMEVSSSTDYMIFRAMDSVRIALLYNKGLRDPTPYLATRFLINTIPDVDWRINTVTVFKELRDEYGLVDIGSAEVHSLCTDVVGVVTDWQAQYRRSILNLSYGVV